MSPDGGPLTPFPELLPSRLQERLKRSGSGKPASYLRKAAAAEGFLKCGSLRFLESASMKLSMRAEALTPACSRRPLTSGGHKAGSERGRRQLVESISPMFRKREELAAFTSLARIQSSQYDRHRQRPGPVPRFFPNMPGVM